LTHPPTSTLFSYTTLFRSIFAQRIAQLDGIFAERDRFARKQFGCSDFSESPRCQLLTQRGFEIVSAIRWTRRCEPAPIPARYLLDRKSTRLNSSHQIISYA